jgi:hypothetical protein
MAGLEKRLNKAAIKIAATWDTEIDINEALAGITPDNQGVPKLNYPPIEVDEINGANETDIDHANFAPSDFSLEFGKFNFDGRECSLIAGLFGADVVEPLFVVTAANNKLDFKDTAAATKAATVASGSYTGTTLATAIAAAMNAAGGTGTFTCVWSASTLKFTIANTLGGPPATSIELLWNTGTNKATDISTLCGFSDAADDTGAATYTSDSIAPGSGAYKHTLSMADNTDGIFFTYAVEKGTKIHVVPSFKPTKLAFSVNAGMIKLSVSNRGSKVTDASAIVTAVSAVTYPAIHNSTRAKYGQAIFLMNAQAGGALAAPTDVVKPKQFTLELERKMDSEHGPGSYTIMEPRSNGKPTVKLTQDFAHLNAANELYFAQWTAQTEKKENITVTGPVIVGTHAYSLAFDLPRLHIEDCDMPDASIIPNKLVMRSLTADSAPTGMTGITKPLTCTIINTRATSFLV